MTWTLTASGEKLAHEVEQKFTAELRKVLANPEFSAIDSFFRGTHVAGPLHQPAAEAPAPTGNPSVAAPAPATPEPVAAAEAEVEAPTATAPKASTSSRTAKTTKTDGA